MNEYRIVLGITLLVLVLIVGSVAAEPFAYITNMDDNTVSVIDTGTNTVTTTVAVGNAPYGVAVNPTGTEVYVTNFADATVSVIDTESNTVIATVPVDEHPIGVAVDPAGTSVFVANGQDGTISVIDTGINTVISTISLGDIPYGVAVGPGGTRLYVTDNNINSAWVIDTGTNTVTTTVSVGRKPFGIAVDPAGEHIYVANHCDGSVSVIDTGTNTVTDTIDFGYPPSVGSWAPCGVAVDPAVARVYVATAYVLPCDIMKPPPNWEPKPGDVRVIDTGTNTVIATVPVGIDPIGVAVNPAGTRVYVANSFDGTVSVIDTGTNTVIATVPVGTFPVAFGQFITPPIAGTPPLANAGSDQQIINTEVVTLDGSASSDPDGTIVSYSWDFGDTGTGTGAVTTHAYGSTGEYTVTLTVTDNDGLQGVDTAIVIVKTPSDTIDDFTDRIEEMNLPPALETGLTAKLDAAKALIERHKYVPAKQLLSAFLQQLNSGIATATLTPPQVDELRRMAFRLLQSIP